MDLGSMLRETRTYIDLTQTELAERLSCHTSDISRIENDKMSLSAERFVKWMRITGRPDILAALAIGIEIDTIESKMFRNRYLKKASKLGFLEGGGIKGEEDYRKLRDLIND